MKRNTQYKRCKHICYSGGTNMINNEDVEDKTKHFLKDPKLAAIKTVLEKDHAIDCLLLLHIDKGRWKDAKNFMAENKLTISDGTFRSRMLEIKHLGLAQSEHIDPLKKYYLKTELGEKITEHLMDLFEHIETTLMLTSNEKPT